MHNEWLGGEEATIHNGVQQVMNARYTYGVVLLWWGAEGLVHIRCTNHRKGIPIMVQFLTSTECVDVWTKRW